MSEVISRLGFHSNGPRHNGSGPCFEAIKAAGRMIALVDCHDDYGLGFSANQIWPNKVLTIGDLTEFESNFDIEVLRKKAAQNPHIRYWQVYNEINGDWVGQTDRLINIMQTHGAEFRFVIYNCASGTPPYPIEDNGVAYSNIARACVVAKAGGHLLGLHEYEHPGEVFRYRVLADYLRAHNALCDIVITEAGPNEATYVGDAAFMDWVKMYDAGLMQDAEYIKGCALWTLGGGGWQPVNFETALPELGDYIATVQPVTPPPPVDEFEFDHWIDVESGETLSASNPYTFTVAHAQNIRAITRPKVTPPQTVPIEVSTDGHGTATGSGQYAIGAPATAEWKP